MASGSQNNTTYQAQKWTNLRAFTIGDTAKDVDGTAAVSWSKDEILGASTDAYFLRGDKVWSNTLNGVLLLPNGLKTGARVGNSGSGIVINDDGGIEIFHTSTPFIDFHYQASTADYSVRLMCDSATNIHDSGSFTAGKYITAKGDITADGGYLYSTLNGNTVQIGSQNGSYAHFTNTKDIPFWFNKVIQSDGGFTIYNTGDNHWRNGYIKINNSGGGDCYIELRRASNADWRMLNSGGHLYFQSNWTSAKGSYYNVLQLEYNSGNINVLRGNISISHATSADMAHSSTNPKITFSESGGQPVHLIYTDYDGYRSPAGLKVVGGASASPAWFEVEGDTHIGGNLRLYRNNNVGHGRIHFYANYKTWSIYMSNAAASACPSGGTPSTLGDVTNWALRSYIENSSGYGWLWESAAESNTGTPTARMALNANNGNLTLAGNLVFTNSGTAFRGINYGTMGDNDQWRIGGAATAANAGYMELATGDDGNEPIYVRQYTGVFSSVKRTLTLLDANGNSNFPGNIVCVGAPQTVTAANMAFNGGVQLREVGAVGNTQSAIEYGPRLSFHWSNRVAKSITLHSNGTFYFRDQNGTTRSTIDANVVGYLTGNCSGSSSSCTGNAATASKLGTATVGGSNRGIYLNAGTATAVSWYHDSCSINGGNTANYPWHRFATCTTGTGQYIDRSVIVIFHARFNGGRYGAIKLSVRTNSSGTAMNSSAVWLYRYGFAANEVKITTGGTTGTDTRFNAWVKCGGWPRMIAYILEGSNNGWSLISSYEPDNCTAASQGTEINASVSGADATDGCTVSYANSAGSSASCTGNAATATALTSNAGGGEQPIYFTGGKPAATSYALKATVNAGTGTRIAYYSDARAISSGSIMTDGTYLRNVGGYNNTSYSLSTASFICNSWIRTTGSTGWYNESHGGGWYMTDNTWIRSYNNKSVYVNTGELRCDGSTWGGSIRLTSNWIGFYTAAGGGTRNGYIQCDGNTMYFAKETGTADNKFDFNGRVYIGGALNTGGVWARGGYRVNSDASSGNCAIWWYNQANTTPYWKTAVQSDTTAITFYHYDSGVLNWKFTIRQNGTTATSSSRKVKHNIQDINFNTGYIIDRMKPVSYIVNGDTTNQTTYGFIYEDLVQILPNVCVNSDGNVGITYTAIIPVLTKEIQNLRKRLAAVETELNYYRSKI